jgi:hypothetical protein
MSEIPGDPDFVRHHLPIILDVPVKLAGNHVRSREVLNLITVRLTEALERDEALRALLTRYGIEWGWEPGTWEGDEGAARR